MMPRRPVRARPRENSPQASPETDRAIVTRARKFKNRSTTVETSMIEVPRPKDWVDGPTAPEADPGGGALIRTPDGGGLKAPSFESDLARTRASGPTSRSPSIGRDTEGDYTISPRLPLPPTVSGISIVIPAWNEEDRLPRTLDKYLPMLEARGEPFEVLVVVDGSHDRTAEIARSYSPRGVRVLEFEHKLGKGGAVLRGLREAKHEMV